MTKLSHIVGQLFVRYQAYINHTGCINVMQVHFSLVIALLSFRHDLKAAYDSTLDTHTFVMHIRKEVYFSSFFNLKNVMLTFSFRLCPSCYKKPITLGMGKTQFKMLTAGFALNDWSISRWIEKSCQILG